MTEVVVTTPGAELAIVAGRLRRVLRERLRAGAEPLTPSEAQMDLLRAIHHAPGLRINEAAAALRVAPNTVSTLVTRLVAAGHVERDVDPSDGRSATLSLTPSTRHRMEQWRARREATLNQAMALLDRDEAACLICALPALRRLVDLLDHVPDA